VGLIQGFIFRYLYSHQQVLSEAVYTEQVIFLSRVPAQDLAQFHLNKSYLHYMPLVEASGFFGSKVTSKNSLASMPFCQASTNETSLCSQGDYVTPTLLHQIRFEINYYKASEQSSIFMAAYCLNGPLLSFHQTIFLKILNG